MRYPYNTLRQNCCDCEAGPYFRSIVLTQSSPLSMLSRPTVIMLYMSITAVMKIEILNHYRLCHKVCNKLYELRLVGLK